MKRSCLLWLGYHDYGPVAVAVRVVIVCGSVGIRSVGHIVYCKRRAAAVLADVVDRDRALAVGICYTTVRTGCAAAPDSAE